MTATKTSIHFPHLAVLILYDIHMDYVEQFLCRTHLPSLIELAINKDIFFTIISQNQPVADLGGGALGAIAPFAKNFSIFSSKNEGKMNLYYLEWTLKSIFC